MTEDTCAGCGLPRSAWGGDGEGYMQDGEQYCCRGCADGSGCTCDVNAAVVNDL